MKTKELSIILLCKMFIQLYGAPTCLPVVCKAWLIDVIMLVISYYDAILIWTYVILDHAVQVNIYVKIIQKCSLKITRSLCWNKRLILQNLSYFVNTKTLVVFPYFVLLISKSPRNVAWNEWWMKKKNYIGFCIR